jgi:hypothetical protein
MLPVIDSSLRMRGDPTEIVLIKRLPAKSEGKRKVLLSWGGGQM